MKIHPAKTKIANSAKQSLDLSVDGMQLTEVESGSVLGVYCKYQTALYLLLYCLEQLLPNQLRRTVLTSKTLHAITFG
ncbi:hypothetical protein pdam_00024422 [Pocillopora damicornis]|uniref:Uncharacterized protein n=1 Tax=Pocillopora damicornis TaxID=46731 RepID=A0A3M6UQ85_POCDA|nr:hypothetical protein pdam_00024422 [Pocillopora damicornis]